MTSSTAALIGAVLPLAAGAVDGDQRLRVGELHPLAHRLRREAAEDDVVDGADARAGEHRHRHLRDHRQEDPDDVARPDPAVLERVREALDVGQQLGVGDVALLALLPAPVIRDAVAPAGLHVAVEAVVGDVQLPAHEPLGERRVRPVEHLIPGLEPMEIAGPLGPEALRVRLGRLVDRGVRDERVLPERVRGREGLLFEQLAQFLVERRAVRHVRPLLCGSPFRTLVPGQRLLGAQPGLGADVQLVVANAPSPSRSRASSRASSPGIRAGSR